MVLPAKKVEELSDDEFEELMKNFDDELDKYIKNMIEEYLTFFLSKGYRLSSIFENKLDVISYSAVSLLEGSRKNLYNLEEVKKKLEEKYKLKITDDTKTIIEEM